MFIVKTQLARKEFSGTLGCSDLVAGSVLGERDKSQTVYSASGRMAAGKVLSGFWSRIPRSLNFPTAQSHLPPTAHVRPHRAGGIMSDIEYLAQSLHAAPAQ